MFIILFVATATLDRLPPYRSVLNCFHLLWLYLLYPLLGWLWRLPSWFYSIAFTFTLTCITFNLYCYCLIVLLLPTLCPFSLYGGLHNGQNCCNVYFLVKFHYYFPSLVMMSWKEGSPCFMLESWFSKILRILIPKDSKDFDSRDFGAFAHTDINITLTITVYCTDHCSIFTIHL